MRVILAIATLLTVLGSASVSVWSFATGKPPVLGVVCAVLAVGFSLFAFNDYKYFFGKNN